jgi:hypothetical protein
MRSRLSCAGLTVLLLVAACGDATNPIHTLIADDAEPAVDTAWLRQTWVSMQQCSGLKGAVKYQNVRFYSVPRTYFVVDSLDVLGVWVPAYKEIYVARLNVLPHSAGTTRTTRHEIMHALLYPIQSHDHPPEWFGSQGPCGNLMATPTYDQFDWRNDVVGPGSRYIP